ncbi:chemotaxis protein CheA, partial [bacterium]|nr:chemotaxis protein CheA [bacterium]
TSGDDALSAEQQESEEAGSTQEDTPSSEVDDDIANHDLIAEILASPDFQDPSSEESLAEIPQEETTEGEASAPPPEERTVQPEAEQPQSVVETASPEPIVEQAAEVSSPPEPVAEEEEPSESPKVPPVEAPETKDIQASSEEKESSESKKSSPKSSSEGSPSPRSGIADSTLRVDVRLLDKVMNLVGELVLARNQIVQFTKSESDPALLNTCQRLNIITSELQEGVMKTRMQPIANVWSKFPRVVRDIARSCGKQIRVEMKGQETELDKTILEAIKDPLTHIVRNSADHGIEPPEVREQNGKSPEGTLLLRAYHEGGHVNIEISDDGGGLNVDRIRSKAIEKGVVSQEKIQRMSEPEIHRLIFHAGFSTAEKVTNVSGRGVGMDVVRSNIEKIGGSVDVQSQSGHGTTLKIKIPLTLAIVPALTVSCGDQRFAIPQVSLLELLRVEEGTHSEQLEEIGGSLFYRLRGNLLPLVDLESELEMTGDGEGNQAEQSRDVINIVVLRAENKDFGLLVKTVHDTEEIVVKPLGRQVKDNPVFAGATIMGDGKVALILDVLGIGRRTGIVHENGERIDAHSEEHAEESNPPQSLLLVRVAEKYRMAIPLNEVDRLEEFSSEHVEYAGSRSVVQYRGGILPLISMSDFFKGETERFKEDGELSVVVYSVGDRQVGVVVDQILDIVEDRIEMTNCQKRIGINGSAVIQGSVTDLLDIQAVLEATDPSLVVSSETEERHDVQEAR